MTKTAMTSTDRIEKEIEIAAPVSRVWRALTNHEEFGIWFQVKLESPFVVGQHTLGRNTYPGYTHLVFDVLVEAMEPERLFVYYWHPFPADTTCDYSTEERTCVTFVLEPTPTGTRLRVTETGFDKIPADRMAEAYRMHDGGWASQMENIRQYVERTH